MTSGSITNPGVAGALGQPITQILFGGNSTGGGSNQGGRFTLGSWLTDDWAVEGTGFFLADRGSSKSFVNNGDPSGTFGAGPAFRRSNGAVAGCSGHRLCRPGGRPRCQPESPLVWRGGKRSHRPLDCSRIPHRSPGRLSLPGVGRQSRHRLPQSGFNRSGLLLQHCLHGPLRHPQHAFTAARSAAPWNTAGEA